MPSRAIHASAPAILSAEPPVGCRNRCRPRTGWPAARRRESGPSCPPSARPPRCRAALGAACRRSPSARCGVAKHVVRRRRRRCRPGRPRPALAWRGVRGRPPPRRAAAGSGRAAGIDMVEVVGAVRIERAQLVQHGGGVGAGRHAQHHQAQRRGRRACVRAAPSGRLRQRRPGRRLGDQAKISRRTTGSPRGSASSTSRCRRSSVFTCSSRTARSQSATRAGQAAARRSSRSKPPPMRPMVRQVDRRQAQLGVSTGAGLAMRVSANTSASGVRTEWVGMASWADDNIEIRVLTN
jgi:hypothetical protein